MGQSNDREGGRGMTINKSGTNLGVKHPEFLC